MRRIGPVSVHHWGRQVAAGLGGQLTFGAAGIGIALVTQRATGSFAFAGMVTGLFAGGAGAARPIQGRLIDRRGAAQVLALCGITHAIGLVALAATGSARGPAWALLGWGVLAGVTVPPVSASMRVSWGRSDSEDDRIAAFSLVTLTQELAILLGPLAFSVVAVATSAPFALSAVALVAAVSTLALAGLMRSPRPQPVPSPKQQRVLRAPGMLATVGMAVLLGLAIGAIEIGATALAVAQGQPAAAGVLIAALSGGGVVGAVVFSAVGSTAQPSGWLIVLLGLFAATLAPLAWTENLLVAGLVLLVAGLPMNPALTALALLVNDLVPAGAAEAFGWLSTATAAGAAAGTALAGVAAQHLAGAQAAFLIGAVGVALGTLIATLARPSLSTASHQAHVHTQAT